LEHFHQPGKIASFLCVRPNLSYHLVSLQEGSDSLFSGIHAINNVSIRINGGYFIFKKKIFDYIGEKEELVKRAFSQAGRRKAIDRLQIRRFLGEHGHVQGQTAIGKLVRRRCCSLGVVEKQRERPTAQCRDSRMINSKESTFCALAAKSNGPESISLFLDGAAAGPLVERRRCPCM